MKHCVSCHQLQKPQNPKERKAMKAPPIVGVMYHVKEDIMGDTSKQHKRNAVNFIVDYSLNPTKEKALCLPQRIKEFGLMPSLNGKVTKDELEEIAEYLYENFHLKKVEHDKMERAHDKK